MYVYVCMYVCVYVAIEEDESGVLKCRSQQSTVCEKCSGTQIYIHSLLPKNAHIHILGHNRSVATKKTHTHTHILSSTLMYTPPLLTVHVARACISQ
jgi:hypothetical protein